MNKRMLIAQLLAVASLFVMALFPELNPLTYILGGGGIMLSAIQTGARTTVNAGASEFSFDFDPLLKIRQNYQSPIQQFLYNTEAAKKVTTGENGKFWWKERDRINRNTTLSAYTSGGTTASLTVADAIVRKNDTLFVARTGQMFQVTNDCIGSTSVTVRLIQNGNGTTITNIDAGTAVKVMAPANTQVYERQKSISPVAEKKYGWTQIGTDALQMSRREKAAKKDTAAEEFAELFSEKLEDVMFAEEDKFLFNGQGYYDSTNDISYSPGFRGSYTSNIKYVTGDIDQQELDDFCQMYFARSDSKIAYVYAGAELCKGVKKIVDESTQVTISVNDIVAAFGNVVTGEGDPTLVKYRSIFGTLVFIWHPMLDGEVYSKAGVAINKKHVKLRYMSYDGFTGVYMVETDVQDNGTGSKYDQIIFDTGLEPGPDIYGGWLLPAS